jgi:hypothetical protein
MQKTGLRSPARPFEPRELSRYVAGMFHRHDRAGISRFALMLTACLALLVGLGALTVRYVVVDLPGRVTARMKAEAVATAHDIARTVADALQVRPRVVVDRRTVVESRTDVLKLVTLEKTFTERQTIHDTWLHSTKTLEIECDFVVQAGFDLSEPFVIDVENAGGTLRVALPQARILGVSVRDVRFLRDEDGFWNKLTPADREAALTELRRRVERNAAKSGLPGAARKLAEQRLAALLASTGRTVRFEAAQGD